MTGLFRDVEQVLARGNQEADKLVAQIVPPDRMPHARTTQRFDYSRGKHPKPGRTGD